MGEEVDVFEQLWNIQKDNIENFEDKNNDLRIQDVGNMKWLIDESFEAERALATKPWVSGPPLKHWEEDITSEESHKQVTDEQVLDEYFIEELVDMWHFLMQEAIVEELGKSPTDAARSLGSAWRNGWQAYDQLEEERERSILLEGIRNRATRLRYQSKEHKQIMLLANMLTRAWRHEGLDEEDLLERYREKAETNRERQDGEVEGREHYE